jgi:hypothetical protein
MNQFRTYSDYDLLSQLRKVACIARVCIRDSNHYRSVLYLDDNFAVPFMGKVPFLTSCSSVLRTSGQEAKRFSASQDRRTAEMASMERKLSYNLFVPASTSPWGREELTMAFPGWFCQHCYPYRSPGPSCPLFSSLSRRRPP